MPPGLVIELPTGKNDFYFLDVIKFLKLRFGKEDWSSRRVQLKFVKDSGGYQYWRKSVSGAWEGFSLGKSALLESLAAFVIKNCGIRNSFSLTITTRADIPQDNLCPEIIPDGTKPQQCVTGELNTADFYNRTHNEPMFQAHYDPNTKQVKETEEKETNMFNVDTQNLKAKFFRQPKNVVIDGMTGKLGIQTDNGVYTLQDGKLTTSMFNMSLAIPAFAMRKPFSAIKAGDILVGEESDSLGFVILKGEDKVQVLDTDGKLTQQTEINTGMGSSGVFVVESFSMGSEGGMNPGLMMALAMGGDDKDMKGILPFMLMQGGMGGEGNQMAQTMMMMSMFGK